MQINGYDYHFAYTVGAFCDIADLHLEPAKTFPEQCKTICQMAVVMSKAYEDKKALEEDGYKPRYLTTKEVRALSVNEVADVLTPEIDTAVADGKYRTVEAEPVKNQKGADRRQ